MKRWKGYFPSGNERRELLARYDVEAGRFVLSTFHRPENVDDLAKFETILRELAALPVPVVLPLHPRSVRRAGEFGLQPLLAQLRVTPPIGYRDFLGLEAESALMISDSGGVQEEASIVKRPVVVVRNSTERPEVLGMLAELVRPGPEIGRAARVAGESGRSGGHRQSLRNRNGLPAVGRHAVEALLT